MNLKYINWANFNVPIEINFKNRLPKIENKKNKSEREIFRPDEINNIFIIYDNIFFIKNSKKLIQGKLEKNEIFDFKVICYLTNNYYISNSKSHFILRNNNKIYGYGSNHYHELSLNKENKFYTKLIEIKIKINLENTINSWIIITKENFTFYIFENKIMIYGNLKIINNLLNVNFYQIFFNKTLIIDLDFTNNLLLMINNEGLLYKWGYQKSIKELNKKLQNDTTLDYSFKYIEVISNNNDFYLLDYKGFIININVDTFEKENSLIIKKLDIEEKAIKIIGNYKFFLYINNKFEAYIMFKKFYFSKLNILTNNLYQIILINSKLYFFSKNLKKNHICGLHNNKKLNIIDNILKNINDINLGLDDISKEKNSEIKKNKSVGLVKSKTKNFKKYLTIKNKKNLNYDFFSKIYNKLYKENTLKDELKPINLFYKSKNEFKEYYLKLLKNNKLLDVLKLSFKDKFKSDNNYNNYLENHISEKEISKKIISHEKKYKFKNIANTYDSITNLNNSIKKTFKKINFNSISTKSLKNNNYKKWLNKPNNQYLRDPNKKLNFNKKLNSVRIKRSKWIIEDNKRKRETTFENKKLLFWIAHAKQRKMFLIKEFKKILILMNFIKSISLIINGNTYQLFFNFYNINNNIKRVRKVKTKILKKNESFSNKINPKILSLHYLKYKLSKKLFFIKFKVKAIELFIFKNLIIKYFHWICITHYLYKHIINLNLSNYNELDPKILEKFKLFDKFINEIVENLSRLNYWDSFLTVFYKIKNIIIYLTNHNILNIKLVKRYSHYQLKENIKKIYNYYNDLLIIWSNKILIFHFNNKINLNNHKSKIDYNIENNIKKLVIKDVYFKLLFKNRTNIKSYFSMLNKLSHVYEEEINHLRVKKMLMLPPEEVEKEYELKNNIDYLPFFNMKLKFLIKINPKEIEKKPYLNWEQLDYDLIILEIMKLWKSN